MFIATAYPYINYKPISIEDDNPAPFPAPQDSLAQHGEVGGNLGCLPRAARERLGEVHWRLASCQEVGQLWPEIPVISTELTPFIGIIIHDNPSYNHL